jgi:uncharacterized protein with HEPN domain
MRRGELLLLDIISAADAVRGFLSGITRESFLDDDKLQSSVLLKLILIGEAARSLPDELKSRHPEIEWSDIIGFRNVLVHEYFAIRWPIIWDTANDEVPALRRRVAHIITQDYPEIELPRAPD